MAKQISPQKRASILRMHRNGLSVDDIMAKSDISRASVNRILRTVKDSAYDAKYHHIPCGSNTAVINAVFC